METVEPKQHSLNRNAASVAATGFLGVGIIYLLVVIQYFVVPAPWDGPIISLATGAVGVTAWLGWFWLREHPPTTKNAHPLMFGLLCVMALQTGFVLYVINDPIHSTNQVLIALSAAFFFSSRPWFYGILAIIALCWLPAAMQGDLQSPDWQQWSRLLLAGNTLSITLFEARRRSVLRIYALQIDAENALANAEVSNRERLAMERMMQESQRRESLGVLAGGIAHDFNNLLTVIRGNTELALLETSDDSLLRELLTEVDAASQRAAELTQQMLAHAGRSKPKVAEVNLNQRIRETARLFDSSLSQGTKLVLDGDPNGPIVSADGTLLDQVILNLIQNALDACSDNGGTVTVRWGDRVIDAETIVSIDFATPPPPGLYNYIEVTDDGAGMDVHTQTRMFEPFFTTKDTGSGLGLAAVQGIASGHGAGIWVESTLGFGTTVGLALPPSKHASQPQANQDSG